jgi:hypothetical protein
MKLLTATMEDPGVELDRAVRLHAGAPVSPVLVVQIIRLIPGSEAPSRPFPDANCWVRAI